MDTWIAVQGAAPWLLAIGAIVLVIALGVHYRLERTPRRFSTAMFWVAALFLAVGILVFAAPYLVIFLGARPIYG